MTKLCRAAGLAVLVMLVATSLPADEAFFRQTIGPILAARCVRCHSGEAPRGGLDLSRADSALRGGESGIAISPKKPEESLLLDYIGGKNPEMPRADDPLSAEQVSQIRRWIEDGATWPQERILKDESRWWSLEPLVRPAVPATDDPWVRTPVDAFILAQHKSRGLSPSPEASRIELIRRLYFDLVGLPPTPQQVADFVKDESPDAYEKLAQRLLDSPQYGERWARYWLDVVHYGDTQGYDKDKLRPFAWPYRDYVIRAFNNDIPYRQFVQEQVAGDVLFPDRPEGLVATGFLVAGPWDFVGHVELREGTTDKLITRNLDRDDIVTNTLSTFNSLTVQCARCHDHKFDSITQKDYYRLQAVFAGIERADRSYDSDPAVARARTELLARKAALQAEFEEQQTELARVTSPELKELDQRIAAALKRRADLPPLVGPSGVPGHGYHSLLVARPDVTKWVQVDLGQERPLQHVVLAPAHVKYASHPGPSFGFPVRFKIEAATEPTFAEPRVIVDLTEDDVPSPGDEPLSFAAPPGLTGRYVRVTATKLSLRTNDYMFALAELMVASEGRNVAAGAPVTALDSIEVGASWGKRNLVDGDLARIRLAEVVRSAVSPTNGPSSGPSSSSGPSLASPLETLIRRGMQTEALAQLREWQRQRAALVGQLVPPAWQAARATTVQAQAQVAEQLAKLPALQQVFAAANSFARQGNFTPPPQGKPRPIYLLDRGNVKSPRDLMEPGTLSCVSGLPGQLALANSEDEGQRRAALAHWLTDDRNGLTWRSLVNRVWQYHFGRGLVGSPNDFGRMGERPTHPELLNWLAVEFRDSGQSLKKLHYLLVTSAVYRQSSQHDPARAALDAGNLQLWRMNRKRLEAEAVRDSVLAISGQLDPTMYGPGFYNFGFENDHSPRYLYQQHEVDDPKARRRTIYRFIVRSVPDPFLEVLDCADPSQNVPVRNTTLTALQALALLNNPWMVRQAEHFAARLTDLEATPADRTRAAYRLAFGRDPSPREAELWTSYAQRHGLANACRLLFNSNEFLFID